MVEAQCANCTSRCCFHNVETRLTGNQRVYQPVFASASLQNARAKMKDVAVALFLTALFVLGRADTVRMSLGSQYVLESGTVRHILYRP